jgi:hypothetical protein
MLYLETANGFEPWGGEAISGVRYPLTIETRWSAEELAAIGLYKPAEADAVPEGKVIVSTSVQRVDDVVKFDNVVEDMALEDQKAAKIEAINAKLATILTGGYTVQSGDMAGKVLQTRNLEDRTNWLVSQASYSAAVGAGQGAVEAAKFRTSDNSTFTLTYADGLNVLLAMAAWGASAMDNSWALKDAVRAAEDETALDAVDIEAGWSG